MSATTIKISSRSGGAFDCYLATPESPAHGSGGKVPAIVLASAVHGVDADLRAVADEFAAHGTIAAAPDLFWRSLPGPLARDDNRAGERSQPRLAKIKAGEADMADALAGKYVIHPDLGDAAVGPHRHLEPAVRLAAVCRGSLPRRSRRTRAK